MTEIHPDAQKWNGRFRENKAAWLNNRPRRLLRDFAYMLPPSGLALDAAAGVATHGLFLARRGLHVIALDISEVGLQLARQQALAEDLAWPARLETAVVDLSQPWLPANTFHVILNFRFLQRETFAVYREALKPGGLLIFETFVYNGRESQDFAYYLQPDELRVAFADWQILLYQETVETGRRSERNKNTAQLVARKPEMQKAA